MVWGAEASPWGLKERVSEEALESGGVKHSLEKLEKVEKHGAVAHGLPPRWIGSDLCWQLSQSPSGTTWLMLTWTFSLATLCP
jgi:hypothetical protein